MALRAGLRRTMRASQHKHLGRPQVFVIPCVKYK